MTGPADGVVEIAAVPATGVAAPDPAADRFDRTLGERVSDRVNPILVREIEQAMNGKTFVGALMLALVGIVLVALSRAVEGSVGRRDGWYAFVLAMQVLAPILLLVVPFQAFVSMRQEVAAGSIEHLLLSRLTPFAVVRGKLLAAAVLGLVFFSVFAPLIALSYLLRGVDVPTIVASLAFAFLFGMGAASLGIALGSISRWPAFRVLPLLLLAIVLSLGAGGVTIGMEPILWGVTTALRSGEAVRIFALVVGPPLLAIPLFTLVACAALAHPYENRSTPFRVYAVFVLLGVLGWVILTADVLPGSLAYRIGQVVPETVAVFALLLAPFWLFAATEPDRLSPRVRTLVPRNGALAAVVHPFLPGGGRGVLWTYLVGLGALLLAAAVPSWFGRSPDGTAMEVAIVAWCYAGAYASLARGIRGLLRRTGRAVALARLVFPLVVGLLSVLPALVDVLLFGRSRGWWPLHVLNPFSTIDEMESRSSVATGVLPIMAIVATVALVAFAVQAPEIVRGFREGIDASLARRRRAL